MDPRELLDFHLSKLSEQNKHFDKKMNNKTNLSKFTDNSSMFTPINSPIQKQKYWSIEKLNAILKK